MSSDWKWITSKCLVIHVMYALYLRPEGDRGRHDPFINLNTNVWMFLVAGMQSAICCYSLWVYAPILIGSGQLCHFRRTFFFCQLFDLVQHMVVYFHRHIFCRNTFELVDETHVCAFALLDELFRGLRWSFFRNLRHVMWLMNGGSSHSLSFSPVPFFVLGRAALSLLCVFRTHARNSIRILEWMNYEMVYQCFILKMKQAC